MEVRSNTLDRLKSRNTTIDDFNFDNLWAPPLLSFLTVEDINYLHKLATSIRYTSKTEFKFAEIKFSTKADLLSLELFSLFFLLIV